MIDLSDPPDRPSDDSEIPFRKRALWVWGAVLISMLLCVPPQFWFASLFLLPYFPLGLAIAFAGRSPGFAAIGIALACWCIVIPLALMAKTKERFYAAFTVLLVLLLFNISGCHSGWQM